MIYICFNVSRVFAYLTYDVKINKQNTEQLGVQTIIVDL